MSARGLTDYAEICGSALARAHARTGDAAIIDGYLGESDAFERAVTDFAIAYAHQVIRDYRRLREAVAAGQIAAQTG